MTAQKAIESANQMKAGNAVPDEQKLAWLTELDGYIYNDCVKTHLHDFRFSSWWYKDENNHWVFRDAPVYTTDNATDELIAKAPDEIIYTYWLMAKIDLFSEEFDKYNQDNALFEEAYNTFKKRYHRQHKPAPHPSIQVGVFRW